MERNSQPESGLLKTRSVSISHSGWTGIERLVFRFELEYLIAIQTEHRKGL